MDDRRRLSLDEQADYVDRIINRCTMRDGEPAGETTLYINKLDIQTLDDIAARLRRMAPFEEKIRRLVTGK